MQGINRKSFYSIIANDKYIIEIPIIQRDYAQGRKNIFTTEIRKDFLKELLQYVNSNQRNNDLDFVYGTLKDSNEENTLTLLDGQQRLTTLFLLHWYAALLAGEKTYHSFRNIMLNGSHSRFTYKTRYSSTDFCDHLVKFYRDEITEGEPESLVEYYIKKLDDPDIKLSTLLKNEKWFNAYWNEDPTIASMLSMLDTIKTIFPKNENLSLYNILTGLDGKDPAITFQFLNLDDYQISTDELYIKMNSRGRPLTRFENLKSKLLKEYELFSKTSSGKTFYNEIKENENRSLREYIALKFDKDWIDMLWTTWLNNNNDFTEPVVDDMFLSLISAICINENINLLSIPSCNNEGEEIPVDIDGIAKQTEFLLRKRNAIEYSYIIDFFISNDFYLMKLFPQIMQLLVEKKESKFILKTFFDNEFVYVNEKSLFNRISFDFKGKGLASYSDRIIFYAYYKYLIIYKEDKELFRNWIRYVSNVLNNSVIDNTTKFVSAFVSINEVLKDSKGDIQNYLIHHSTDEIPTSGLYKQPIMEERIKAILSQNAKWKETLLQVEKDTYYFQGELNYPLQFYSNVSEATVLSDIQDETKLDKFSYAAKRLKVIFGTQACKFPDTLSRALLTKGNYLRPMGNMLSFLTDKGRKTRDLSWKTYLGDSRTENDSRRQFFTELINNIDDTNCNEDKIESKLESICQEALQNNSIEKWRIAFISTPGLFAQLGPGYRYIEKKSDDKIYLLLSDNRGKYHTELFSMKKYYDLLYKKFNTSPFEEMSPFSGMGKKATLGFQFNDKNNSKKRKPYHFLCEYAGNDCFNLSFFGDWDDENKKECKITDDSLCDLLKSLGYVEYEDNCYYLEEKIPDSEVEEKLQNLLSQLTMIWKN